MYNLPYNNSAYNTNPPYGNSVVANSNNPLLFGGSGDKIVFDGFGLQNGDIITSTISHDDYGQVELNSFKFPRENGGGVLSKYFRGREIKLKTTIKAETPLLFNLLMDSVKKALSGTEKYLDITINGETRRIKATCTKFDAKREHYNVTFCVLDITFTAVEPFFYAKDKQSYFFTGLNTNWTEDITVLGSADTLPVFYHSFTGATSITKVTFSSQGKSIEVSATFIGNDILIIDSENKKVFKNGVEIDYTGSFPTFKVGSNVFNVAYVGSPLVGDVTILANKNYL